MFSKYPISLSNSALNVPSLNTIGSLQPPSLSTISLGLYNHSLSTHRGSLLNLNVWNVSLTTEEMVQMTKKVGSFKCSQIVSRDYDVMIRWRDFLNYASAGTVSHYSAVINLEEDVYLIL